MTIWVKTCFWTWNSRKSKKPRAFTFVKLLKVATGVHFQDSKFKIWLKDPGLSLVSFYAPGPFVVNMSFPQKLICPIVIFRYRFQPVDLFMDSVMHGLAVVQWSMVLSETYTSRRIVQDIERVIHFFLTRICSYHAIQTRAAEMSKILVGTMDIP